MDGDELMDGRQGQDGIQDGPSTLVQCGGAALVPATATPSCISKQKSIACDKIQGVSSGLNVLGDAAQRRVMEKIEKEKADNAKRVRECRLNQRFEEQKDDDFTPVPREIFCGNIKDLHNNIDEKKFRREDLNIVKVM